MEIFVRLLVKILDYIYPRPTRTTTARDPLVDEILKRSEEDAKNEKLQQLVDKFQSTASPVQGAVDYGEIRWDSFSKAAETTEQFTFYSGRSVAKVIEKSKFSSRQELLTFRRMIRRQVADNELLHD